jgi:hypothetical protein
LLFCNVLLFVAAFSILASSLALNGELVKTLAVSYFLFSLPNYGVVPVRRNQLNENTSSNR